MLKRRFDLLINKFLTFFIFYKLHPNGFFSYYYYTELTFRKKRSFLLSTFFFNKNLFYVLNIIIFINFLNANPLALASKDIQITNEFQSFVRFFQFRKINYVFAFDLDMIHKYIFTIIKFNVPVFSIISKNTNIELIDYPIIIRNVNNFSMYLFFMFFLECFLFGRSLRNDFLKRTYLSSQILIFLKKKLVLL